MKSAKQKKIVSSKLSKREITAYFGSSREHGKVLNIHDTSDCSARTMSEFVLNIINETILSESLMLKAMKTMQEFLIENDFNPKVEKPVIDLVKRIKQTYGLE